MPPRPRKRSLEVAEALRAMATPDVGLQSEPMEDTNAQIPVAMPPRSR